MNGRMDNMWAKFPGNESSIGHSFSGAKVPGSEMARERIDPGAKRLGTSLSISLCLLCRMRTDWRQSVCRRHQSTTRTTIRSLLQTLKLCWVRHINSLTQSRPSLLSDTECVELGHWFLCWVVCVYFLLVVVITAAASHACCISTPNTALNDVCI